MNRITKKQKGFEESPQKLTCRQALRESADDQNNEGDDQLIDNLTLEQSRRLRESIKQAREGNTISHDDVMKMLKDGCRNKMY